MKPIRRTILWSSGIPKGVRFLGYRVTDMGERLYPDKDYTFCWVTETPQWGFWKRTRKRSMRGK